MALAMLSGTILLQAPGCVVAALGVTSVASALTAGGVLALVEPRVVTRASVEADGKAAGLELTEVNETLIARDNVYLLRKK